MLKSFEYTFAAPTNNFIQVILTGSDCHGKGMESYQCYLSYLYKNRGQESEYENFSQGYEELLQIPLQPLKDNLDNATYEVIQGPSHYSILALFI